VKFGRRVYCVGVNWKTRLGTSRRADTSGVFVMPLFPNFYLFKHLNKKLKMPVL
jgi:hypothetical protein